MIFPPFPRARLLVVGDVMLDRYWSGPCHRVSPEAPVPIVHIDTCDDRLGGGANVARNAVALGAHSALVGRRGEDEAGAVLHAGCLAAGIQPHWVIQGPTTVKLRVHSRHQQLLRLDFETLQPTATAEILAQLAALADDVQPNALVLSDYRKGLLSDPAALVAWGRARGIPVLIDPAGRDYAAYAGATVLTPNVAELEAVTGPCFDDEAQLLAQGTALMTQLQLEALLITRAERGMTLLRPQQAPFHLAANAREVFDVTGAGDTVIAVLACALAAHLPWETAVHLANTAAGLVVGKWGTATVTPAELRAALAQAPDDDAMPRGILDPAALRQAVAASRRRGEKIVFTNGCFDLLHAGHVAYLQQARALGDRLLVAVNDDASVRALKGPTRPLNPLADRQAVLAGLGCVDWVTAFSDPTPAALIAEILPEVLVKGGDYRPEDIVGADQVRAAGGTVQVLPYRAGCSTTGLIAKAQQSPPAP